MFLCSKYNVISYLYKIYLQVVLKSFGEWVDMISYSKNVSINLNGSTEFCELYGCFTNNFLEYLILPNATCQLHNDGESYQVGMPH